MHHMIVSTQLLSPQTDNFKISSAGAQQYCLLYVTSKYHTCQHPRGWYTYDTALYGPAVQSRTTEITHTATAVQRNIYSQGYLWQGIVALSYVALEYDTMSYVELQQTTVQKTTSTAAVVCSSEHTAAVHGFPITKRERSVFALATKAFEQLLTDCSPIVVFFQRSGEFTDSCRLPSRRRQPVSVRCQFVVFGHDALRGTATFKRCSVVLLALCTINKVLLNYVCRSKVIGRTNASAHLRNRPVGVKLLPRDQKSEHPSSPSPTLR